MPVYAWKIKVAYKIKGSKSGHLNSLQTLTLFKGIFHIHTGWSVAQSPIDIRFLFFTATTAASAAFTTTSAAAAVNGFTTSTAAATAGAITFKVLTNFVMTGRRTSSESHTKVVGC